MPHPMWRHPCCSPEATLSAPADCPRCGQPSEFAGCWRSVIELMGQYQYVYGLRPLGPHRALANGLLNPLRTRCAACHGSGIISVSVDVWRACVVCEGTGGMWVATEAELQAAYLRIFGAFPDAGAPDAAGRFVGGGLVGDLANGGMIDPRSPLAGAALPVPVATAPDESVPEPESATAAHPPGQASVIDWIRLLRAVLVIYLLIQAVWR